MVLPRHGPEAPHLPHEPLERLDLAAQVLGDELAGLAREIKEDRPRFEDADRLAAACRSTVHDGGNAVVRRDLQELGLELLALADIDRVDPVLEAGFLQEERDLVP